MSKNRIILTGGGTAGHVTPNLALIKRLQSMGHEIEYIGSSKGIERELIGRLDIPYHAIAAGKLRRYFDWRNFTDIFRVLLGFLQSLWLMLTRRPDVLFSKGGFVSAPVVWAAWLFRIPVILHESDYSPGLANKIKLFCTTYDPVRDGYYFDYSLFIGMLIGGSIIIFTAVVVVRGLRNRPA